MIVRELTTVAEAIEAARLRYDTYASMGYLVDANASQAELDAYDEFAVSFGAFAPDDGRMIGTVRLIDIRFSYQRNRLFEATLDALCDPRLVQRVRLGRRHPLPSLVSYSVTDALQDLLVRRTGLESQPIMELSRAIVRPEHRGTGVSRLLMEAGIARAIVDANHRQVVLIGSCTAEHVPMYARYGYERLGNETSLFESVGRDAYAIACLTDRLPEPTRTNVDALVTSMRRRPG